MNQFQLNIQSPWNNKVHGWNIDNRNDFIRNHNLQRLKVQIRKSWHHKLTSKQQEKKTWHQIYGDLLKIASSTERRKHGFGEYYHSASSFTDTGINETQLKVMYLFFHAPVRPFLSRINSFCPYAGFVGWSLFQLILPAQLHPYPHQGPA